MTYEGHITIYTKDDLVYSYDFYSKNKRGLLLIIEQTLGDFANEEINVDIKIKKE